MTEPQLSSTSSVSSVPEQLPIVFSEYRPDRVVVQHNDLIRAQYGMSLLELRLFIAMLARINRGDKEFSTFRIPVSELYPDDVKVGGKTYSQIKKAVVRLASQTITLETRDAMGVREVVSNPLMATCRYREKSGFVVAQFNNFVKPYLLELTGDFTTAQELTLITFRSFYSFRVYWLLKLSAFQRDTVEVDLLQMKRMFDLVGKYNNFADFKRNVLDKAQNEVSKTDMAFDYKLIKEGKTVVGIVFILLRPTLTKLVETSLPDGVQQKLTSIGISLKSMHDIKLRYQQGKLGEEYIRFVLDYYENLPSKARIRSMAGVVFRALNENQLQSEFEFWKSQKPVYKAPQASQVAPKREDTISLVDLKSGWETMFKKGLSTHATFEESLEGYRNNPNYRFEVRDGIEVLIYTEN